MYFHSAELFKIVPVGGTKVNIITNFCLRNANKLYLSVREDSNGIEPNPRFRPGTDVRQQVGGESQACLPIIIMCSMNIYSNIVHAFTHQ